VKEAVVPAQIRLAQGKGQAQRPRAGREGCQIGQRWLQTELLHRSALAGKECGGVPFDPQAVAAGLRAGATAGAFELGRNHSLRQHRQPRGRVTQQAQIAPTFRRLLRLAGEPLQRKCLHGAILKGKREAGMEFVTH